MRSTSKLVLSAAVATTVASLFAPSARATDFTWGQLTGGTYSWDDPNNWTALSGFPNAAADTANTSVAMTGNLLLNLPVAGVTVSKLTIGTTGNAFTTDVGNANNSGGTFIFGDNAVNPTIDSLGTAGASNIISAPVVLLRNLDVLATGTNNITFNGPITASGGNRGIANLMTVDKSVVINGNILLSETGAAAVRGVTLGSNNNATGTIVVNGVIDNGGITNGTLQVGGTSGNSNRPTVYLNNTNIYTGATTLARGNLYLSNNSAVGTGTFQGGGQGTSFQRNIYANGQDITLANTLNFNNHLTFVGDHSIKFTGIVFQGNSRLMVNNINTANSETLSFDGVGFAICSSGDAARTITLDGTGTTEIKSAILNHRKPLLGFAADTQDDITATGSLVKGGTGLLNLTNDGSVNASTYKGFTVVRGGLLQFSVPASYGATSQVVVHPGGAVSLLSAGSSDATFLGKIQAGTAASTGALALSSADAAVNLDFTGAGNMSHANTVGMSIGAAASGATYTGTITPPAAGYRLGGGGTLTLPNANQLTGANDLTVANGGTVVLGNSNNFTGKTVIKGAYLNPIQAQAAQTLGQEASVATVRVDSTLAISSTGSLGGAADDASNLVIGGGTLRYTGGAGTSNRLFTINPTGATLDASGSGAINFANGGAIVSADVGAVTGDTTTGGTIINNVSDTSELTVGMTITGGTLAGQTITGFTNAINSSNVQENRIRTSGNATTATPGAALTFGAQNRALNLTGSNTANNTVAGSLGNSATGTLAVNKTGAGRWVLSNLSNSYTGGTNVSAGTLAVGRMHANNAVNITGGKLEVLESTPGLGSGHPAGNDASVSQPSSLTIAAGATLDVTNNDVILDYTGASPVATYEALVASAYNVGVGDWSGTGITSSVAQADGNYVVAIADNAALAAPFGTANGGPLFAGVDVDIDTILIKFTHRADVDLDGVITPNDAAIFGGNYSENDPAVWSTGDMDYDGIYTPNDAAIFGGFYDESLASLPEPGSLALLGLGGLALGACRRRVTVA